MNFPLLSLRYIIVLTSLIIYMKQFRYCLYFYDIISGSILGESLTKHRSSMALQSVEREIVRNIYISVKAQDQGISIYYKHCGQ